MSHRRLPSGWPIATIRPGLTSVAWLTAATLWSDAGLSERSLTLGDRLRHAGSTADAFVAADGDYAVLCPDRELAAWLAAAPLPDGTMRTVYLYNFAEWTAGDIGRQKWRLPYDDAAVMANGDRGWRHCTRHHHLCLIIIVRCCHLCWQHKNC